MRQVIATLPGGFFRTVTWDQGINCPARGLHIADRDPGLFCDPHSPWQRGPNENTNGLFRQYMPKGTDLSVHRAQGLPPFPLRSLNNRPRKTLGFMKPSRARRATCDDH